MAKRRLYRPVAVTDNASTTGNIINPTGAMIPYNSSPSTAQAGQRGQYGAMLPTVKVAGQGPTPDAGVNNSSGYMGAFGNLPGYYGTAGTPAPTTANPRFGVAGQQQNPFSQQQARTPYPAYGMPTQAPKTQTETSTNVDPLAGGSFANPEAQFMMYLQTGQVNAIPGAIAQQTGMEELLKDPNSGWTFQNGEWRQTAAAAGGARTQDKYGNAWDASTAKTDIYGGQFVQEGERRWVRGGDGKLRRQVATRGGWQTMRGGGGRNRNKDTATNSGFTGSYGVVTFNTGTG